MTNEPADRPDDGTVDRLTDLLHSELRAACSASLDSGTSAEEITADLTRRLDRVRGLNPDGRTP